MSANIPAPVEVEVKSGGNRSKIFLVIGAAVVLLLLTIGLAVWMFLHPGQAQVLRDIFISFLACETIFLGFAVLFLIWQIYRLTQMLRNEIKPLIQSANETLTTVRGTTVFVSNNVVTPAISAAAMLAGAKRAVDVIMGRNPDNYFEGK